MKVKFIFPLILSITIGFLSARLFYELYGDTSKSIKNNSYFIEIGEFTDKDILDKTTKGLKAYLTIEDKGKSHVYVGITSNKENSLKLKKIYESKGYDVSVEENYISDLSFYSNLVQYDILLSEVEKEDDLISISKVILSSYEELV